MFQMELRNIIEDYFGSCKAMQLVTIAADKPWISTVYFVHDNNMSLYWTSDRSRRHSIEILSNKTAAATIVKDIDRKQALQMTGTAFEVADEELEQVHALYTKKYGPKDYDLNEMRRHHPDGRAYWVFKPDYISLWDEVNFPNKPKQEYEF